MQTEPSSDTLLVELYVMLSDMYVAVETVHNIAREHHSLSFIVDELDKIIEEALKHARCNLFVCKAFNVACSQGIFRERWPTYNTADVTEHTYVLSAMLGNALGAILSDLEGFDTTCLPSTTW